jgi:hypothetical protein
VAQEKPDPSSVFGPISVHFDQSLEASQNAKYPASLHAIQYLEQYLNGIILQWNRIVSATYQRTWPPVAGTRDQLRLSDQEELDFHFYLICWDKVGKYFTMVVRLERDTGISEVYRRVSKLLHDAKEGRNFYEHLDKELRDGGIGTRGRGFSYPEGYHFSYVEVRSGQAVERQAKLGMKEIGRISEAYQDVIAILKARRTKC